MTIHQIIFSGGSGTWLWSLSRETYPKQFHNLFGERSLLQEIAVRVDGIARPLKIIEIEVGAYFGEDDSTMTQPDLFP